MANIADIAKAAGVSVATVSRVLNHHPYVRAEKRRAVLAAIERLNYSPNMNAVHLTKGATKTVGVVLPFINHVYFSRLLEGIAQGAAEANYHLMIVQTNYDPREERAALEMLKVKQIDGLIICSKSLATEELGPFTTCGPILACEDVRDLPISSIYIDQYACFQEGMNYLTRRGHRKIGICLGRSGGTSSGARLRAYTDSLRSIAQDIRDPWVFYQCYNIEDGVRVMEQLERLDERPTAMLVTSDQVAAGMMMEAGKRGIRIPEDLALIGFDNQPIARVLDITTMDNQLFDMGRQAFQIVCEQAKTGDVTPVHRRLSFRLIERATV